MAFSDSDRGSALVEALAVLSILLLAIFFNLELIRRATIEVALRHAAFAWTRDRALGLSRAEVRRERSNFLRRALGARGTRMTRALDEIERWRGDALEAGFHYRYPFFVSFRVGETMRHHFELTRVCRFPY